MAYKTVNDINHPVHPSKMPIPPPRKKKKGFILSSIKVC